MGAVGIRLQGLSKRFAHRVKGEIHAARDVSLTVAPGAELARDHPAAGKALIGGRATAYVCPGQTCLPPVTEPGELAGLLTPARLREVG